MAQRTFFQANKEGPSYSLDYLLVALRKALPSVGFTCSENERGELVVQTGMFRSSAPQLALAAGNAPHCGPCTGECEDEPCSDVEIQWGD